MKILKLTTYPSLFYRVAIRFSVYGLEIEIVTEKKSGWVGLSKTLDIWTNNFIIIIIFYLNYSHNINHSVNEHTFTP